MTAISEEVKKALAGMEFSEDGLSAKLGEQYDREFFLQIRKVFDVYGVKYKGGRFNFPFDFRPVVEEIIATGTVSEKRNPTAFFPTPGFIVENILSIPEFERIVYSPYDYFSKKEVRELGIKPLRILEPSAGQGAIADIIKAKMGEGAILDVVEFFDGNADILERKGYDPIRMDFMEYNKNKEIEYDFIIMNPPYSLKGRKLAYIDHVMHAWSMLKEGGSLAAVLPTGFMINDTKREREFLEAVCRYGEIREIHDGAFKDVGTSIKTVTVVMHKTDWKEKPFKGHENFYQWLFGMLYNDTYPEAGWQLIEIGRLDDKNKYYEEYRRREKEIARIAGILKGKGGEAAREAAYEFIEEIREKLLRFQFLYLPAEHKRLYLEAMAEGIEGSLYADHKLFREEVEALILEFLGKEDKEKKEKRSETESEKGESLSGLGGLFDFAA